MAGASRGAYLTALRAAQSIEARGDVDIRSFAGELFAVAELLAEQPALRRALTDPARDMGPKRELVRRVLAGKIGDYALEVVEDAAGGRWAADRDIVDAVERIGIDAVLAAAEREGRLHSLEDELFEVQRLAAHNGDLAGFLARRDVPGTAKAEFVSRLLAGRVSPDAQWLAMRPALNPRGRRYDAALNRQLAIAAERRRQVTAIVTSAVPLSADQKHRIEAALTRIYGRSVNAYPVVDPAVVGGLHIRVGDDVIDGSISRRLGDVRRALAPQ